MAYILVFLEGIITFVSPCMLPMLPLYLSYFSGGSDDLGRTLRNATGFILGFTLVFLALGAFAGQMGRLLIRYQTPLNLVTGAVVILFGLCYLGVLKPGFLARGRGVNMDLRNLGFGSSVLFGLVFSIGWTPCVGAFLGSALMMAASTGSRTAGILMLLCFSLGLGLPFLLSALLIQRLKAAFDAVKRHYAAINAVSGVFLIAVGICMMTGLIGRLTAMLSVWQAG